MDRLDQDNLYHYFSATALVPMTLRVAVAGHRVHSSISLDNTQLAEQIEWVYRMIGAQLERCYQHSHARKLYYEQAPILRIISSLADGADRLLVESHLVGEAFELSCILPFSAEEYANDFDESSRKEYYQLLKHAGYQSEKNRVLELDGRRSEADEAYRVCGESLVKNCDLLVALYDGEQRQGYGTAFTVKQALDAKIPVIWIDTEHPNSVFFIQQIKGEQVRTELTEQSLYQWLGHVLLFDTILDQVDPDTGRPLSDKIFEKFDQYSSEHLNLDHAASEIDFNDNGPIQMHKSRWNPLLNGFNYMKRLLTSRRALSSKLDHFAEQLPDESDMSGTVDHLCQHFHSPTSHGYYAAYLRADRLASFYSALHRSIFVFIYMLGASALIIAALAIALADKTKYGILPLLCAVAELAILASIYWLYKKDHNRSFHDKWLEYRCIAEFLRPTLFLSFFGTNYPLRRFRDIEDIVGRNLLGHGGPERCWAYLYTETVMRWVGFSGHQVNRKYINTAIDFTRGQWLTQQYRYHTKNAIAMKLMGRRLAHISEFMFWSTMVVISGKILMGIVGFNVYWLSKLLGLLATWLPVVGTTSFAIRNHAEFEISAQRSLSSREVLLGYNRRLQALQQSNAPMEEIDALLVDLTADSISETADWLEIYEVKESETA